MSALKFFKNVILCTYYAIAINNIICIALGTIASQQSKATESTIKACTQLFNYLATHPDAVMIHYEKSNMCLWTNVDASYLSESEARSCAGGFFHLSSHPSKVNTNDNPPLNGPVHIISTIMRKIMASATEAEVGAAFISMQESCSI
jgi:hypothetical protein